MSCEKFKLRFMAEICIFLGKSAKAPKITKIYVGGGEIFVEHGFAMYLFGRAMVPEKSVRESSPIGGCLEACNASRCRRLVSPGCARLATISSFVGILAGDRILNALIAQSTDSWPQKHCAATRREVKAAVGFDELLARLRSPTINSPQTPISSPNLLRADLATAPSAQHK